MKHGRNVEKLLETERASRIGTVKCVINIYKTTECRTAEACKEHMCVPRLIHKCLRRRKVGLRFKVQSSKPSILA